MSDRCPRLLHMTEFSCQFRSIKEPRNSFFFLISSICSNKRLIAVVGNEPLSCVLPDLEFFVPLFSNYDIIHGRKAGVCALTQDD